VASQEQEMERNFDSDARLKMDEFVKHPRKRKERRCTVSNGFGAFGDDWGFVGE